MRTCFLLFLIVAFSFPHGPPRRHLPRPFRLGLRLVAGQGRRRRRDQPAPGIGRPAWHQRRRALRRPRLPQPPLARLLRRLDEIKKTCDRLKFELIPAIFSVGYGSPALGVNPMLAEGIPVSDAPFLVGGPEARLIPDQSVKTANPSFEEVSKGHSRATSFTTSRERSALSTRRSSTRARLPSAWRTSPPTPTVTAA